MACEGSTSTETAMWRRWTPTNALSWADDPPPSPFGTSVDSEAATTGTAVSDADERRGLVAARSACDCAGRARDDAVLAVNGGPVMCAHQLGMGSDEDLHSAAASGSLRHRPARSPPPPARTNDDKVTHATRPHAAAAS